MGNGLAMRKGKAKLVEQVRRFCLTLPEAAEQESFGEPWFRAGKKPFAMLSQPGEQPKVCLKVPKKLQGVFLEDERFTKAPYIGQHGWVLLPLDEARVSWRELRELILQSYRLNVPKKIVARLVC